MLNTGGALNSYSLGTVIVFGNFLSISGPSYLETDRFWIFVWIVVDRCVFTCVRVLFIIEINPYAIEDI